jgi:hypothetical protein
MMLGKTLIRLFLIGTILAFAACSAINPLTYQPSINNGQGYFEREKSTSKWMVGSYYNSYKHSPQQAANIVMRRAAEQAVQSGAKWMRILHYDTEKNRGPIASLPALDNLTNHATFRGMLFYGNQDAAVTDDQIRIGITSALVEYFEYAREIDCQAQKCETVKYYIEECIESHNGGTRKAIPLCNEIPAADNDALQESCADHVQLISEDFCSKIDIATHNVKGEIEERNPRATGAWYKTEDVLKKYILRSEEWASEQNKR